MKKIISLFQRNYGGDNLVRDEIVPGAEWVVAGEGTATRKWDGTCCLVRGGKLYKRLQLKRGRKPPEGFEPVTDIDPVTGNQYGWVPVGDGPEDVWFREAISFGVPRDGSYELCGPKVRGNPEECQAHVLIPHGLHTWENAPRTFDELREWFKHKGIEGLVWHHPDGRMIKIKARDFGIKRVKVKLPDSIVITVRRQYYTLPEGKECWVGYVEFRFDDSKVEGQTVDCASAAEAYGRALTECRKHLNPGRK